MTRRGLIVSTLAWPVLGGPALAEAARAQSATGRIRYGPDPRQRLDVFAPKRGGATGTAVLILTGADPAMGRRLAQALARAGMTAVAAGVRAAPDTPFSDFTADAARATAHAADLVAVTTLGVLGWGSGAQSAWMIARDRRYLAAAGRPGLIGAAAVIAPSGAFDRRSAADARAAFAGIDRPPMLRAAQAIPEHLAAFFHDALNSGRQAQSVASPSA